MVFSLLLLVPHLLLGAILTPSLALNQFGPAVGLFAFSLFPGSPVSIRDVLTRFHRKGLFFWGVTAVLSMALLVFACSRLLFFWGLPFSRWKGNAGFYCAEILAMFFGCVGEELGWRGFLLPELCKKYPLLPSACLTGLFWGVWHLNFSGGGIGFLLFTVSMMMNSIFLAWLFQKSGENLYVAVLAHLSFNLSSHLLLWNRLGFQAYILEIALFGILDLVLLNFDRNLFFKRPQKPDPV